MRSRGSFVVSALSVGLLATAVHSQQIEPGRFGVSPTKQAIADGKKSERTAARNSAELAMLQMKMEFGTGLLACEMKQKLAFTYAGYRDEARISAALREMHEERAKSDRLALEQLKIITKAELPETTKAAAKEAYTSWAAYLDSMLAAGSPREAQLVAVGPAAAQYRKALQDFELEQKLSR